ncbi:FAD/NAD-binding domain-containing protein [Phanerochaete sordida]|uniref:FAD/NAD-binding domain-containing protein n=1 Tax=Phanerochaete sordida TaxID=48140 RepID=A0A9P3LGG2_9APHY|nr:FAD/NAD-binding domain-containing protein [Phanerochaete sordida]
MAQVSSPPTKSPATDPVNWFARNIIKKYQDAHDPVVRNDKPAVPLYQALGSPAHIPASSDCNKVAIIGGGIGGLYAAYLLQSVQIPYTIYEASKRTGGRLYTCKTFNNPDSQSDIDTGATRTPKTPITQNKPNSQWDYIDMGAMRFPETPIMRQLFDLFEELKLNKLDYYLQDREANSTLLYNGIRRKRGHSDIHTAAHFLFPGVPHEIDLIGVHDCMQNVTKPFKDALKRDAPKEDAQKKVVKAGGDEGYKLLMEHDIYSTRAYMQGRRKDYKPELDKKKLMPYPVMVVNWCETIGQNTSSFDSALTEAVLEELTFEDPDEKEAKWYSIEGGSSEIAEKLLQHLKRQGGALHDLQTETPVTALQAHHDTNHQFMAVQTAKGGVEHFGHVITTTTLPCLRAMDLSRAELDIWQSLAVRSLSYTSAVKIGVKFRTAWWQNDALMKKYGAFGKIVGGQSFTDRLVRRVVYPSHGVDDSLPSTVLMACYGTDADAQPWAGLAAPEAAAVLKNTVINDLVDIHGFNDAGREFLNNAWQNAVIQHWGLDPYTLGSWGFFSPGQFAMTYSVLTRPAAGGMLHFAGEGVSARHGWIIGAIEASKRAVCEILISSYPEKLPDFEKRWSMPEAWTLELLAKQIAISMHYWDKGRVGPEKSDID